MSGKRHPILYRTAINNKEEFEMKKVLLIGATTLAVSVIAGTALASPLNSKEESTSAVEMTPAAETTPAVEATTEVKTASAVKATPSIEATKKEAVTK